MQLDYIGKVTNYGDSVVRLYDFNKEQSILFRTAIQQFLKSKKPLDLSSLDFIIPRNCNLILRIAKEDEGITTEDEQIFYCDMTTDAYEEMVELINPFCLKDTRKFQYLYELDVLTEFLYSPAGSWEEE